MLVLGTFLSIFCITWFLSLFILPLLPAPRPLPSSHGRKKEKVSVLLVIAHPDDESMFFSPTLLSLASLGHYHVRLLCLSTGNVEGLGGLRKQELLSACSFLKVPMENVEVLDNPALQDGHNVIWSQDLIARILKDVVSMHKIDMIITFDSYGVSGHPNHSAVYRGLSAFLRNSAKDIRGQEQPIIEAWKLKSVNIFRKFCGPINAMACLVEEKVIGTKDKIHCFYNRQPQCSAAAMKQHATQWIWYRQLFVIFSHYTYINTLHKVTI